MGDASRERSKPLWTELLKRTLRRGATSRSRNATPAWLNTTVRLAIDSAKRPLTSLSFDQPFPQPNVTLAASSKTLESILTNFMQSYIEQRNFTFFLQQYADIFNEHNSRCNSFVAKSEAVEEFVSVWVARVCACVCVRVCVRVCMVCCMRTEQDGK